MTLRDLAAYRALTKAPIHSQYKGLDVYGMPVPSSGGIAVAEILNLIEAYEGRTGTTTSQPRPTPTTCTASPRRRRRPSPTATARSATSRASRSTELTDPAFAAERACLFDPTKAQPRPIPFGSPDGSLHLLRARHGRAGRALRGPVDDAPDGDRPLGQRRLLHPDHRADRRLGHHRARATASCSTTSSPTSTSPR